MITPVEIDKNLVGPGHPCFIMAEAGINHNGNMDQARKLIDVAAQAGADYVKFQTFKAGKLACFQEKTKTGSFADFV